MKYLIVIAFCFAISFIIGWLFGAFGGSDER